MLPFVIKNDYVKESMGIVELFPTPVGVIQIDEALNKNILAFLNSNEIKCEKSIGGNAISVNENFLDNDELSDVKQVLTDSVNEYFKRTDNPNKDTKLYITISWLNVTENGEAHHTHHHPNSIVSGVLYIDTCEEDTISFINPRFDMFGNFSFSHDWNMPVINGRLLMFPSTLKHHVVRRPNTCKGKRISIAFNTWIKGVIDSGRKATLHLN